MVARRPANGASEPVLPVGVGTAGPSPANRPSPSCVARGRIRERRSSFTPAPRPGGPCIRVPPNRVETAERRSPTGIARQRETSADHAAPYQRADRTTFESRSARPLAAPATRAVPFNRHRGPAGRETRIAHCEKARGRLGTPTSGRHRWAQPSEPRVARLLRHVRPQPTPLERHVPPADPASATCSPGRSGYCDMFASSRSRYCDMFPRQIRLLRHVRLQPIPLLRHVPPADPATATCSDPADPASATCSPRRPGYCDM